MVLNIKIYLYDLRILTALTSYFEWLSNRNVYRYFTRIYYVLKFVSLSIFLAVDKEAVKEASKYRIIMFVWFMGLKCQWVCIVLFLSFSSVQPRLSHIRRLDRYFTSQILL